MVKYLTKNNYPGDANALFDLVAGVRAASLPTDFLFARLHSRSVFFQAFNLPLPSQLYIYCCRTACRFQQVSLLYFRWRRSLPPSETSESAESAKDVDNEGLITKAEFGQPLECARTNEQKMPKKAVGFFNPRMTELDFIKKGGPRPAFSTRKPARFVWPVWLLWHVVVLCRHGLSTRRVS